MKKDEAERRIRSHIITWADEVGYKRTGDEDPRFTDFFTWLKERDPECLDFRTRGRGELTKRHLIEKWWASIMQQSYKY